MKTEIIINDNNISRYNKRTQKAVSELLGKNVKLSEASELLSNILGLSSAHELKKLLEKDVVEEFKEKIKNSKLSTIEKIILISKQIQKMLRETKAEFWYAVFATRGGDTNPFYGTPEYNGLEIHNAFTGLVPFDHDSYSPFASDQDDGMYADILDDDLEWQCICYGDLDTDIKNTKEWERTNRYQDEECIIKRTEIYKSKKETQLLRLMMDFTENMLYEMVNEMKSADDFWLIERDKITISLGEKTYNVKEEN